MSRDSFSTYILDQLAVLKVNTRRMFGSYGLYSGGVFFGIIWQGRLFFKTDVKSRTAYLEHGMEPFQPNEKQTLKSYYEVPVEIIEDSEELVEWARLAVAAQDNSTEHV